MPLSDAEASRLFSRLDRMDDRVEAATRGDAAHDILLARQGQDIEDLRGEMRRGFEEVRRDLSAGITGVGAAVADIRQHQQKQERRQERPWFRDAKVWGIVALALIGGGNTALSVKSATADPAAAISPALPATPTPVLPQEVIDILSRLETVIDRRSADVQPAPTPDPDPRQSQRGSGRRVSPGGTSP